jgi:glycosyltransferase involved in cell wall biosynthesis
MRIIHLSPHCDEVGNGVVNVAVDLAITQREAGHSVGLVSHGGSMVEMLEDRGVEHFFASMTLRQPAAMFAGFRSLSRVLSEFEPDIVHAHMVPGAVFARLLRRRFRFRLITTVHNAPQPQAVLMGLGDRVIVVSAANLKSMAQRGLSRHKLRLEKNGPLDSPRRPHSAGAIDRTVLQRPAIVSVARLFSQKGIGDIIESFAAIAETFPEACLYFVGAGPEREKFEKKASETGVAHRIHFVGFVKDPRCYLRQADIFVLASHSDPFPLVIPEAREAGCAIVATDVDGIREGLEEGRAGLLVPPSNPAALAKELHRLLSDAGELAAWRERARTNLEWLRMGRVVTETLAIYKEALAS